MKSFLTLLSATIYSMVFATAADAPLPNIVLMMADDMGLGDTSVYLGRSLGPNTKPVARTLRTPHLDDFAKDSVIFTQAYASASMCSSTRYALLTGRYSHRSYLKKQGWLPHGPNAPMIQQELSTLPEMLQQHGYRTAAIGKYHVGMTFSDGYGGIADEFDYSDIDFEEPVVDGPTHHGFDEFFGVPGNTEDSLDTEPRIFIRDDRWTFTDRSQMQHIGMNKIEGRILAAPDWDLSQIGPRFLDEALAFIDRQEQSEDPFFLYYVPCANHIQRNEAGPYAVPDSIAGEPVRGASRYTDGTTGTEREDMVLENDIAFGKLLTKLRSTDDPRNPGKKLIDNTLVIFTSDNGPNIGNNNGPTAEAGGLRGKKAKIWEGGIRVPFIVYLKDQMDGGRTTDTIFSQTDLYATVAQLLGHQLQPHEAVDSHNTWDRWLGTNTTPDLRPRVFFCHLGPVFSNDTLAIRKGNEKLLADAGLAMPWITKSKLGAALPNTYYHLESNPYEEGEEVPAEYTERAQALADELLLIHNRGYCRDIELDPEAKNMILSEGWHNLRNDLTGEIGMEFTVAEELPVSHLGMWNHHHKDKPNRAARDTPTVDDSDTAPSSQKGRNLKAEHTVRLLADGEEVASIHFTPKAAGKQDGPFRYLPLTDAEITLSPEKTYTLLLSTVAGDGDYFRDYAAHDGLSPLVHPHFHIVRSVLYRVGERQQTIPSYSDLHADHTRYRLPVGPTLRIK